MINKIPHVLPYQGSKRKIAADIIKHIQFQVHTLYEPFAGSAAITLAASAQQIAEHYVISDKLQSISDLWSFVINNPIEAADKYEQIWNGQLENPRQYFLDIRQRYNEYKDPIDFLYLTARSVKNAIRFNSQGEFNQSPDNRRLGTHPDKIRVEMISASNLLQKHTSVECMDFSDMVKRVTPDDLLYLDPPWQGTSKIKDSRYAYLLKLDDLLEQLYYLNSKNIPYLLSFDGKCGNKIYGAELPDDLGLEKHLIHAGRSTQATLLGRDDITYESLYLSPALLNKQLPNFFELTS